MVPEGASHLLNPQKPHPSRDSICVETNPHLPLPMKTYPLLSITCIALLVALPLSQSLLATPYTWLTGSTTFSDPANWSPAGGPPGAGDDVTFSGGNSTMSISGDTTVTNFTSSPTASRTFQRGAGGGTFTLTIGGTLTKSNTGALVFRNPGSATNRLALNINALDLSGSGTLAFGSTSSGNSHVEALTIGSATMSGGVLQLLIGATTGTANITGNLDFTGAGTVNVRSMITTATSQAGVLNVGSLSSNPSNGTIQVNANSTGNSATGLVKLNNAAGTSTYSGVLQDGGSVGNVLSLEKTGAGTQVLAGTNTYTGATTIDQGTLSVAAGGSLAAGSAVAVNNTGKLSGSGTVAGSVTVNSGGTISPGNSPGTLNTGAETWEGGGNYLWEINDFAGAEGTDPGWDLLSISGGLTLNATSGTKFTIAITSLTLANASGDAANFSDGSNYQFRIADATSAITTFDASAFDVNTSAFDNTFTGTWGIFRGDAGAITGGDNTELYLAYVAIPEPGVWVLLSGVGMLWTLRRNRRR